MSKLLKYKGFSGSVTCSIEDGVIHGKIECINDLITYEAEAMPDIEAAFQEAVDDYLETCEMLGKSPDKPMSGSFNIRVGSELHKTAYLAAKEADISLNDFVKCAIEEKVSQKREVHLHLHTQEERTNKTAQVFTSQFENLAKPFKMRPVHSQVHKSGMH